MSTSEKSRSSAKAPTISGSLSPAGSATGTVSLLASEDLTGEVAERIGLVSVAVPPGEVPGLFVRGQMLGGLLGGLFSGNYPGGTGLASGSVFGRAGTVD
jgi:hypothetical protein